MSDFTPALGYHTLTRLYDPVLKWTTREFAFKSRLLEAMHCASGQRVLDVGCGTGTLTIALRQTVPGAEVVGIDADPRALQIARKKAESASLNLSLQQASATCLPFADGSFDHVVSSLMFHHLTADAKKLALSEMHRVLAPGGQLHIADWGRPQNHFMRLLFFSVQLLDGFATTSDSVAGALPGYAQDAGFTHFAEYAQLSTPCGTLALYQGYKPPRTSLHESTTPRPRPD